MLHTRTPFAQTPNIITYQGKLTHQGKDISGERTITARLYTDAEGTSHLWEGTYKTYITDGIFALPLGTGKYPLPTPSKLDKQLWVGITVDGIELRPLTQLTSSPYALNVADKSITKAKLADDVLVGVVGRQDKQVENSTSNHWGENGNSSLATTSYLGTSDASPLPIKVNALQVMKYTDAATTDYTTANNILGGYSGNAITGSANVIAGGGFVISGTGGGGRPNRIGNSVSTIASIIGGGSSNDLDGNHSVLGGGQSNALNGQYAMIGGGYDNTIGSSSGQDYATIVGGSGNTANGQYSFIGGGNSNTTSDTRASVVGGASNTASGEYSSVLGGANNTASGDYSSILGGKGLTLSGNNSSGIYAYNSTNLTISASNTFYLGNLNLWLDNNDNVAREIRLYEPDPNNNLDGYTSFKAPFLNQSIINYILPGSISGATGKALVIQSISGTNATLAWGDPDVSNAWKLTGNSGTTSVTNNGANFLGTIDNKAFDIQVNSNRVMRYQPDATSPNIVGGYKTNNIPESGVSGSIIAGGGSSDFPNSIYSSLAFIGGGGSNIINSVGSNSSFGVIAGGLSNELMFDAKMSAIVGGSDNNIDGKLSFIGGGVDNTVYPHDDNLNLVNDTSYYITIAGGHHNFSKLLNTLTFPGQTPPVGVPVNMPDFGSIGGGAENCVHSDFATVGGGLFNHSEGLYSTIPGGWHLSAFDWQTVVGRHNRVWPQGATYALDDRIKNHFDFDVTTPRTSHVFVKDMNYPIFIVGNGGRRVDAQSQVIRSNAFEVSESGHARVTDNLGTDWNDDPAPTTINVSTRPMLIGAQYVDNTTIAWGRVRANTSLAEGAGVFSSGPGGFGTYIIELDYKDPYTNQQVPIAHGSAVVATIEWDESEGNYPCKMISTSPITFFNGRNRFKVKITQNTFSSGVMSCSSVDAPFSFVVYGRP